MSDLIPLSRTQFPYYTIKSLVNNVKSRTVLKHKKIYLLVCNCKTKNAHFCYDLENNHYSIIFNSRLLKHISLDDLIAIISHEIGHAVSCYLYPFMNYNIARKCNDALDISFIFNRVNITLYLLCLFIWLGCLYMQSNNLIIIIPLSIIIFVYSICFFGAILSRQLYCYSARQLEYYADNFGAKIIGIKKYSQMLLKLLPKSKWAIFKFKIMDDLLINNHPTCFRRIKHLINN